MGASQGPTMLGFGENISHHLQFFLSNVEKLISWLGLVVFTLGWAYDKSTMLFLTSRVENNNIGLLYSIIAVIMTVGGIMGGPMYGSLFSLGWRLSGSWLGLPFFVAAGVYGFSGLGLWLVGSGS